MPLYEYRCRSCERVTEVIQSFSDPPRRKCEACGGRLDKLISRSGFILKGGGWYKSDYGSPAASKKGEDRGDKSGSSESDKGGSSEGGKSDSSEGSSGDAKQSPAEKSPARKKKGSAG